MQQRMDAMAEQLRRLQLQEQLRNLDATTRAVQGAGETPHVSGAPTAATPLSDQEQDQRALAALAERALRSASLIASADIDYGPRRVKLGEGASAKVYQALYAGTPVAVKVPRGGADASADDLARFGAEVRVLCRLRHPRVLLFIGACVEPGRLAIVTELQAGGSLYAALHAAGRTVAYGRLERARIALDIALGMR
jgi:hypothetical protein